jgi:DNA processing protein
MGAATAFPFGSVSPEHEMGAYEHLWTLTGQTWKRLADMFRERPDATPSEFVSPKLADEKAGQVLKEVRDAGIPRFGIRLHRTGDYPKALRDAANPVELLYYSGYWDLIYSPCVAVVGTRKPSAEGVARTRKLVRGLAEDGYTIVSGLADGVDTIAHETALECGAPTIAVIGTPLSRHYPRANKDLQRRLECEYLVISQVPFIKYAMQDWRSNRAFFPERNKTMSALTVGTVIVEAGDTSGTLIQARAALQQKRRLMILESCFQRQGLMWPAKYEKQGGIRVSKYEDIRHALDAN